MNLELENCRLRSWQSNDDASLQRYADNRNIWLNLRDAFPHPYSLADARSFIEFVTHEKPETTFAMATLSEAIGCIGLRLGDDMHRKTAELGYWLAEPFWGKGIMTEAVTAFTAHAFDSFELVRIFAQPFTNNAASIRVLEKASFSYEGRLVAHVFKDGQVIDALVYAKVRTSFGADHFRRNNTSEQKASR